MIIGISGKKRSGKDTVYQLIRKDIAYRGNVFIARAAFGDDIKEEVAKATGKSLAHIEENKERFRPILQWWGADFRRHYEGENYWLDRMQRMMSSIRDPEVLVITDVRYPNEANLVKSFGGIMIRVKRETGLEDPHSSENLLDYYEDFDYWLNNDGTLENLENQVAQIVEDQCCATPDFRVEAGAAAASGA